MKNNFITKIIGATLAFAMMIGGAVRWFLEKKKNVDEKKKKDMVDNGVLYCSGLIAGEGLVGILLAVCAIIPFGADGQTFADFLAGLISNTPVNSNIGGIVFFVLLILSLLKFTLWRKEK